MRIVAVLIVVAVALVAASPAAAWDPFLDPGVAQPTPAPPPGLYLVTEVYAGDTVTSAGATTTYGTTTVRDAPGTYARVLGTVVTGQVSPYEGRSINTRRRLPDGRLVAGTYYEDFVLTAAGYMSVNIVFFQDDALTAATAATAAPVPTAAPTQAGASAPRPAATPDPRSASATATPRPASTPIVASAGVALTRAGVVLGRIEVLRGRSVSLWPRVFVNGRAVPTRTWRLLAGSGAAAGTMTGTGASACDAVWIDLGAPGAVFTITFDVTASGLPGRTLRASIEVAVRSPALLQ